ncbi:hypothetical protein BRARA_F02400 [Brassica rapa]|uniref:Uncharacterized protein n=1 Tax=Brassica campestris TaxID=3711 RepID=A0A397ZAB4_BRACM|nr:hypothetical protein BRARA_F02400 [Brassica rapa]CAG7871689.1 unnamed protein product [Brassica rapa]VDC67604.1 unnamed protein product [Brassica rapa]
MDCRKHKHQGNEGVCPSCLRDKLSRLPNTTTSYYITNRSSSSSTTVSPSPSSPPTAVKDHHRRAGSMSMSFAVREALSGNLMEGLKKSRSMAHAPRDSYNVSDSKKKKKTGFWKKLLHLKGKGGGADVGGLVTSRQRVF